jgi:NAD(P)-dependent dehydrogenase (short-subunit alcohol dehydrogenase family)
MNAFTFELARRLEGTSVTANCLHPGVVATNIWGADPPFLFRLIIALAKPFMLNSKEGAAVSLYLASSPDLAQTSGQYFVKSKPAEPNPLARDPKVAGEIWDWTQKMIGVSLA